MQNVAKTWLKRNKYLPMFLSREHRLIACETGLLFKEILERSWFLVEAFILNYMKDFSLDRKNFCPWSLLILSYISGYNMPEKETNWHKTRGNVNYSIRHYKDVTLWRRIVGIRRYACLGETKLISPLCFTKPSLHFTKPTKFSSNQRISKIYPEFKRGFSCSCPRIFSHISYHFLIY